MIVEGDKWSHMIAKDEAMETYDCTKFGNGNVIAEGETMET